MPANANDGHRRKIIDAHILLLEDLESTFSDASTDSVTFSDIIVNYSREEAISKFNSLLLLNKYQLTSTNQEYGGPIIIRRGPRFPDADSWLLILCFYHLCQLILDYPYYLPICYVFCVCMCLIDYTFVLCANGTNHRSPQLGVFSPLFRMSCLFLLSMVAASLMIICSLFLVSLISVCVLVFTWIYNGINYTRFNVMMTLKVLTFVAFFTNCQVEFLFFWLVATSRAETGFLFP